MGGHYFWIPKENQSVYWKYQEGFECCSVFFKMNFDGQNKGKDMLTWQNIPIISNNYRVLMFWI